MLLKPQKIESEKLREWCKGQSCTLRIPGVCKDNGRNTCGCHLNSNAKGWGNKSPDFLMVIGCYRCHEFIDGGWVHTEWTKAEVQAEKLRALKESLILYAKHGFLILN
ncbi:nuclease domain-containing protein [Fodinibius sp.]|uniref:nuclease domain-containing protein n=1 Tax=Fodinibius sp. TaxID=1872440 RepID=UPI002ACDB17B|nr:nuclease domain-containing protein [Fodinibius sp.]MDZ7658041.1 nuclease domain-containing protein [Fodinibius sp.]